MPRDDKGLWKAVDPGTIIDQYRVIRLLGRGGMGEVYLARDTQLGRLAALKILSADDDRNPRRQEMFTNEARLTAVLSHPNVVTLYGVGKWKELPYVALEFVEGSTLRERMRQERVEPREIVRVALGVARAIAAAHDRGVLHRDLKPSNVIMASDGRPRVVDFGVARAVRGDEGWTDISTTHEFDDEQLQGGAPRKTRPPSRPTPLPMRDPLGTMPDLVGSPSYMAPERWAGFDSKPADVWSLGIILFELVAGRHPYPNLDAMHYVAQVTSTEPIDFPDEFREVPADLAQLVRLCLAKEPHDRPTASEVVEMLEQVDVRPLEVAGEDSPFRGLASFTEDHADMFFGRDDELEAFLERMRSDPILVVSGPSGAGKSSFVRAGVIPRLQARGHWQVVRVRPGVHPLSSLGGRLLTDSSSTAGVWSELLGAQSPDDTVRMPAPTLRAMDGAEPETLPQAAGDDQELLTSRLRESPESLSVLLNTLASRTSSRVLLVVDQAEELHTLTQDGDERRAFIDAVCTAAVDPLEPVRVVIVVRDDFLGRIPWGMHARVALSGVTMLRALDDEALRETVSRPLRMRGYAFDDPTVIDEMVASVHGEAAALPLLQFVLTLLWRQRDRTRKKLLRSAYEACGSVVGALAEHADGVVESMSPAEARVARSILLRLVTAEGTRRPANSDELVEGLGAHAPRVLDRLVDARLLSVRRDPNAGEVFRVELAHELLASTWGRLRRWISENSEELSAIEDLRVAAELWSERGSKLEELWDGDALRDANRRIERAASMVPPVVREFVRRGMERRDRYTRIRRRLLAGLVSALVVAASASLLAAWTLRKSARSEADARQRAEQDRARILQESALTSFAQRDPLEARVRLRSALELRDTPALRSLWSSIASDPLLWLQTTRNVMYDVAFSPDGRWLAVGGQDVVIRLIDTNTFRTTLLTGHRDQVFSLAFSPDGKTLASGDWNGEIRSWNLPSGESRVIGKEDQAIESLVFSHDGASLIVGSQMGSVRVLDARDGKPILTLAKSCGRTVLLALAPGDDRVAAAGRDKSVQIYRSGSGEELIRLEDQATTDTAAFSADGRLVAASNALGGIAVWEAATGKPVQRLRSNGARVLGLVFSGDGQRLFSGGYDDTLREWDVSTGAELRQIPSPVSNVMRMAIDPSRSRIAAVGNQGIGIFSAHWAHPASEAGAALKPGIINEVVISPDSSRVVSGGTEQLVVWDRASARRLLAADIGPSEIWGLALDDKGERAVVATGDGAVRVHLVPSGQMVLEAHGASRLAGGLALHDKADLIAATGPDGAVMLWSLSKGALVRTLLGHAGRVYTVAFDRSGKRLATTGSDGTLRVWEVATGAGKVVWRTSAPVRAAVFEPNGTRIAAASEVGEVVLIHQEDGRVSRVGKHDGRIYALAFHPDGKHLAFGSSDANAHVWDLPLAHPLVLRGHRAEVNSIDFSRDGKYLVSGGDDGTVRLWHLPEGLPAWHGIGVVEDPLTTYGHDGWFGLRNGVASAPPGEWKTLAPSVRLSSRQGGSLCLVTFDEDVLRWEHGAKSPTTLARVPGVDRVVAAAEGCAVQVREEARLLLGSGSRTLSGGVTAVGADAGDLLVATRQGGIIFDAKGARKGDFSAPPGVTALARTGDWLVLGFGLGSVERRSMTGGAVTLLSPFAPSRISLVVPGPRGMVAAGCDNGVVGVWDVASGDRLGRFTLHGAPVDVVYAQGVVHGLSELGDRASLDLRVLDAPYCDLLQTVWKEVPQGWSEGGYELIPAPAGHPCKWKGN